MRIDGTSMVYMELIQTKDNASYHNHVFCNKGKYNVVVRPWGTHHIRFWIYTGNISMIVGFVLFMGSIIEI